MAREKKKRRRNRQPAGQSRLPARRAAPEHVPDAHDDYLLGGAVAALVAGIGVPTLAVWTYGGWGAMFGFLALFGTIGGGMIASVLTNRKQQRAGLWAYIATGVTFAVLGALWLLS